MKNRIVLKKFNNFNTNGIKTKNFYNFYPKTELKPCFSIKPAQFPESETGGISMELTCPEGINYKGIASFKQYFPSSKETAYRILIYGDDKKVYLNQLFMGDYKMSWLYKLTFDSAPITLAYKNNDADAIILTNKDKMMIWKTNFSPYTVSDVPIITSMCMNDGVLFCTIAQPAFKIWYATNLDLEEVGNIGLNSGYISLEDELGDANKIIAFDGEVFVFRDYGISKIIYLQKSITVSQIYNSNSKIIANSVSVCGNAVMFLTFDGVYTFNGTKVKKLDIDVYTKIDGANNNAVASSLGNYYYLAMKLKYDDKDDKECVNNSIIIIDITDYSYQIIRGVDVLCFHPLRTNVLEKMLMLVNNEYTNKIFEIVETEPTEFYNNLPKKLTTSDLVEDGKIKLLTCLTVDGGAGITYTLNYDNKRAISFTSKQEGVTNFNFRISCNKVSLTISTSEQLANVNRVELTYYDN